MIRWRGLIAAGAVAAVAAACGSSSAGTDTATVQHQAPPAPEATTTASGATVVLAMGDLTDPSNTFFELFTQPVGATTWKLATPPGVADNGGLVVGATDTGTLTAGFLPSADLTFSVLAQSTDAGTTWNPASLPGALASEPDALGTGGTGQVVAVLAGSSGRVVSSSAPLTSWHPVASAAALSGPTSHCTVTAVTAVAVIASGTPVLGTRCASSRVVGLFVPAATAGRWSQVGPVFGGPDPSTTTVLRLQAGSASTSALVEGSTNGHDRIVGEWLSGVGTSVVDAMSSAQLAVPTGWSVRATALGGGSGDGMTVLLGADAGAGLRIASVSGPNQAWVFGPTPPAGTTVVAVTGEGTDAFVPAGSHLAVWSSTSTAPAWTRVSQITVPIQYGSSD